MLRHNKNANQCKGEEDWNSYPPGPLSVSATKLVHWRGQKAEALLWL